MDNIHKQPKETYCKYKPSSKIQLEEQVDEI